MCAFLKDLYFLHIPKSPPSQETSAYRVRPVLRISRSLPQCLRIVKIERDVVKNRPLLLPLKSSSVKKNMPETIKVTIGKSSYLHMKQHTSCTSINNT